jgi:hypothetical protein
MASTVGARYYGENSGSYLSITHCDEGAGRTPSFGAMVLHVHNIRNLKVPGVFVTVLKSVLYHILSVSWFHCILLRLNVYFHMLGNENPKAK